MRKTLRNERPRTGLVTIPLDYWRRELAWEPDPTPMAPAWWEVASVMAILFWWTPLFVMTMLHW